DYFNLGDSNCGGIRKRRRRFFLVHSIFQSLAYISNSVIYCFARPNVRRHHRSSGVAAAHVRGRDDVLAHVAPLAKPVLSGSSGGEMELHCSCYCAMKDPVGRRMVAEHTRFYLLVPSATRTWGFPPAPAPNVSQVFPQVLAQLGDRWHFAEQ